MNETKNNFFEFFKSCTVNQARFCKSEINEEELRKIFLNLPDDENKLSDKNIKISLSTIEKNDNSLFSINLKLIHCRENSNILSSEKSVEFTLAIPGTEKALGNSHCSLWWMTPQFCNNFNELNIRTQGALLKCGKEYIYLLPLNGDNFNCEFGEGKIYLSIGSLDYDEINGPFLCIAKSNDPYRAISNAYHFARQNGAIKGKLIEEKNWPEQIKGLGMCTWNMCYKNLTSEKIYNKLEELNSKNIPVQWFLFDNGWLQINDQTLLSFKENREKIPEGLKQCISTIKNKYGIRYVGVWLTFNGYWMGIDPSSELYEQQKENLIKMHGGTYTLSDDENKAFLFWDSWHSYLKECGVDFIKVDSQSTYPVICEGSKSNIEYTRSNQKALEKSVQKNFNGAIINCMGMDMQNVLERDTAISRTSGDFNPDGHPERFYNHLYQNAWNSLWHSQLYIGDFDMFWSASGNYQIHESLMRSISGGPIYLSDEIGSSNYENLRPCINEDGSLPVMDHAALPTNDIIFENCYQENRLIKIWNQKGANYALAIFSHNRIDNEKVNLNCIPGINPDQEYMVYEYFTKSKAKMSGSGSFSVSIDPSEVRAYSIMPVIDGNYDFFDEKLFFPFAGKK